MIPGIAHYDKSIIKHYFLKIKKLQKLRMRRKVEIIAADSFLRKSSIRRTLAIWIDKYWTNSNEHRLHNRAVSQFEHNFKCAAFSAWTNANSNRTYISQQMQLVSINSSQADKFGYHVQLKCCWIEWERKMFIKKQSETRFKLIVELSERKLLRTHFLALVVCLP
jgi:hypothetical protein